jgi:protease-4
MFNNKLGITFDRVTTSQYADLGYPNRPMSEYEAKTIQKSVNKIYGDFINIVKKGRNFPDSLAVDSIAQGRVWSGIRAKQIGLVDEIGGLDDAIQKIAKAAGLGDDYQLVIYPEQPSFLEKFFKLDNKTNLAQQYLNAEQYQIYKQLKIFARDKSGIYMLEPYEYDVK